MYIILHVYPVELFHKMHVLRNPLQTLTLFVMPLGYFAYHLARVFMMYLNDLFLCEHRLLVVYFHFCIKSTNV